jgi:lysophospholipase L1-like esterase
MNNDVRICFLGESFVNGTGDPECLGWTGRICATLQARGYAITHYNLGVRAETSRDLKRRWLGEVTYRLPPSIDGRVVFSFGVNDMGVMGQAQGIELAESIANLHDILRAATQHYPVLMIGPPPCGDVEQARRNQILANLSQQFSFVCNQLHVPYLDVFTALVDSPIWLTEAITNDGAHPRASGYGEFAAIVDRWPAWHNWFPPLPTQNRHSYLAN